MLEKIMIFIFLEITAYHFQIVTEILTKFFLLFNTQ